MLGTVSKAARVLEVFTPENAVRGVTDVAQALGLPKSSTHSLLTTLADTGLLEHTEDNRYRLGWRVLSLGRSMLDGSDVRTHAQAVMKTLVERYGVTVHIATLNAGEITYIDKASGPRSLTIPMSGIGRRVPAHCSALGKVLLAHQPPTIVEDIAERSGLPRFTSKTVCDLDELRAQLLGVRKLGYGEEDEEIMIGLSCFAAPIFDLYGLPLASISVSIPTAAAGRAPQQFSRLAVGAGVLVSRSLRTRTVSSRPDEPSRPAIQTATA